MENIDKIDLNKLEREVKKLENEEKQLDREYKEIKVRKLLRQKQEILTRIKQKKEKIEKEKQNNEEKEDATTGSQETLKIITPKKQISTSKVKLTQKDKEYEERRITRQQRVNEESEQETPWITRRTTEEKKSDLVKKYVYKHEALKRKSREDKQRQRERKKLEQLEEERQKKVNRKRIMERNRQRQDKISKLRDSRNREKTIQEHSPQTNSPKTDIKNNESFDSTACTNYEASTSGYRIPIVKIEKLKTPIRIDRTKSSSESISLSQPKSASSNDSSGGSMQQCKMLQVTTTNRVGFPSQGGTNKKCLTQPTHPNQLRNNRPEPNCKDKGHDGHNQKQDNRQDEPDHKDQEKGQEDNGPGERKGHYRF